MRWTILFLPYFLITGCTPDIPECPCEPIPEEQTRQGKSTHSTEFYSGLNAKIDTQIKMVQGEGKLDLAFKNLSELSSEYFTKLGFSHDEVKQYNLIVNQLCNVWRNMHAGANDEATRMVCREQYLEGLQALQSLVHNATASKAPSLSMNEFLLKAEKEIATIQWELGRTEEPNSITDLDAVIAQIQHLQNLVRRDSSKVEFCDQKLETITQTYKKYRP